MESIYPFILTNIHWFGLLVIALVTVTVLLRHKQRRHKKLLKLLKRHGIVDNQQRFQS